MGCVLTERLLRDGHRVTVLDNLERGGEGLRAVCADANFKFIRGDVCDEYDIAPYDAIVPLAGVVGQRACDRRHADALGTNAAAICGLMRDKSKDQLVIYPMTNSGYGTTDRESVCTEESPLEPISHYGRTKRQGEQAVLDGENGISLRLATVFGASPNMRWDLLVNDFVRRAVTDRCIAVFQPSAQRNFVHVRDVADCIAWVLGGCRNRYGFSPKDCGDEHPIKHRVYNLGNDSLNMMKWQLACEITALCGVPGQRFEVPGDDPDKRDYVVSSARLREAGFVAKRGLKEGVAELVKAVQLEE